MVILLNDTHMFIDHLKIAMKYIYKMGADTKPDYDLIIRCLKTSLNSKVNNKGEILFEWTKNGKYDTQYNTI
jgi:hypothetical protein